MWAEQLPPYHAKQAANGWPHGVDGALFGFGVKQRAGIYPSLEVILHLLPDIFCGSPRSLYAAHILQPRDHDGPATIETPLLAFE